jgi:protein disulfide-isomerase
MTNLIKILMITTLLLSMASCKATPPANSGIDDTPQSDTIAVGDSLNTASYTPGTWITNYEQAIQYANEQDKVLLINFTGSDWCVWCKKLAKEVFDQQEFQNYAKQNLILLKLDFPRSGNQTDQEKAQNEALAKKYQIQGFPSILLLDKTGKTIGQTGYQAGGAAAYVEHLKTFIK